MRPQTDWETRENLKKAVKNATVEDNRNESTGG